MTDNELLDAGLDAPCPVCLPRHSEPLWLIGVVEGRDGKLYAVVENERNEGRGIVPHGLMSRDHRKI
jgi:hypothetical protein